MHYGTVVSGERAGSVTAVQMPTVEARFVCFKAAYDNVGKVYLGGAGVTVKDGTTDATTGFPLAPGEVSPMFPIGNVNEFYIICDNAGDDICYIAIR